MKITNGSVFTDNYVFEKTDIVIEDKRIKSVADRGKNGSDKYNDMQPSLDEEIYDASGCYVVPGFTDIHFHGCAGYDFSDYNLTGLQKMGAYELESGITQICPATMTYPEERLNDIIDCAKSYSQTHTLSDLVGINLEGPFIAMSKRGAQNPAYIVPADYEMFCRLKERAFPLLKIITIAPETEGALSLIQKIHNDITVSLGHTTADYQTAKAAFENGACHVTHLFNAMPAFLHRNTGVIGAAFDSKSTHVELICDGVHISDSMIRAGFQLFTDDRIVLISDSMMATGMPDGVYALGGQAVTVQKNRATLLDGTIAGSVTNLMDCFRYAVSIGIPLTSALKAATINPARAIGIDKEYGSITPGKIANLLILNHNLTIKDVILHGKIRK